MAPPEILLLLVHFHNGPDVERFIRHLAALAARKGRTVAFAVADNSGGWEPAADLPVAITRVEPGRNIGYLTGCACAYAAWQQRNPGRPRWVGVVNTDLTFSPGWTEELARAERCAGVGVVAPDIRLESGIRQNPHLRRRPSRFGFLLYLALHRHPRLYSLPLALHRLKQWAHTIVRPGAPPAAPGECEPIYAPHGSAMFFHREFFARGGTLFFDALMYGEEVFVAEQARRLGLTVLWCPKLVVVHHEHAVVGRTTREWRRARQIESLEYLRTRFFTKAGEAPVGEPAGIITETEVAGRRVRLLVRDRREHLQKFWLRGDLYEYHLFGSDRLRRAAGWLYDQASRRLRRARREGMLAYAERHYRGGTFLDVGSCLGNHTLFFALACEADLVVSFEPVSELHDHQQEVLRLNRLANVKLFDFGLGAAAGRARIEKADFRRNIGRSRIGTDPARGEEIELRTLDSVVDELALSEVQLLKIDVEGFNLPVLRGARETLARFRPDIFVECETRRDLRSVERQMQRLGYRRNRDFVFNLTATYLFQPRPAA